LTQRGYGLWIKATQLLVSIPLASSGTVFDGCDPFAYNGNPLRLGFALAREFALDCRDIFFGEVTAAKKLEPKLFEGSPTVNLFAIWIS